MFELGKDGYITKYLYSRKKEEKFEQTVSLGTICKNQLEYEKLLRGSVINRDKVVLEEDVVLGSLSQLGSPWKYHYSYGNLFLDVSTFYLELHKVEVIAATCLEAEEEMEVELCLWSYDAMALWVNNELAGEIQKPVYKPIQQVKVKTLLKKGKNDVFVWIGTLGVRDTRIGFGIQVLDHIDKIKVSLPVQNRYEKHLEAEEILDTAMLKDGILSLRKPAPKGSYLLYHKEHPDFYKRAANRVKQEIDGEKEVMLEKIPSFSIHIPVGEEVLRRGMEQITLRKLEYLDEAKENHTSNILERIGKVRSLTRSETEGFALYPMLARLALGADIEDEKEDLWITLSQIERRVDCADFMICALIRIHKQYELPQDVKTEMKRVMLSFRYWMNEEGQDGMCFWSENHSLMFYQAAYFFGQEYPEEIFIRSGKTGKELYENAKIRLLEWLADVCEMGFDEFNSGVYSGITFSALLNLVDFGEPQLRDLAKEIADELLDKTALHCFGNVVIAPQGRIYRDVIYPGRQSLQGVVNFVCKEAPYVFNEWLSPLGNTAYQIPKNFVERMNELGEFSYQTSNAVVDIYKTSDYILTSARSPRRDGVSRVWDWNMEENREETFLYTKSLNECFHGTTQFEPGVLGYQQHMWYGGLSNDLVVFTNHPGTTCEDMAECRPGYWFGNGITPAIRQEKSVLGIVYIIPDTQPVKFTHIFWEKQKFDECCERGQWLFGRKAKGYIGIWCHVAAEAHNDVLFDCEMRCYGEKTAYLCVMGQETEDGSFGDFMESCLDREVSFDEDEDRLTCKEFSLEFQPHDNKTQYIP